MRGFRVELGEVEAAVGAVSGVREAAVVAREWPGVGGRRLVAYVSGEVTAAAVRAQLQERLPDYMVPAAVVVLAELPLTGNGKVDREALPEVAAEEAVVGVERRQPRTAAEAAVLEIWREVLGLECGVEQNFFELGGHSLLASRILYRVRDTFRVELPLRSIFETPTIEGFAQLIEDKLIEELERLSDDQAMQWLDH